MGIELSRMASILARFWHWLTTSRYTLALEEEVMRLRAENRALLNSVLGAAGMSPLDESKPQKVTLPPHRATSWMAYATRREMAAADRESTKPHG